ncbi:ABC transporter substrate-binding protein [Pseudorhodoplanes sp.]|uniref:ABC transporter substrate-binding protein n=1 Tax=Pseudorhodoplanes sp. TaxID=1934341 RepID=UPI003918AFE7
MCPTSSAPLWRSLSPAARMAAHQAGLKIPLVMHAASMDQAMVKVLKDAAVGVQVASQWNDDFDNPASKAFVAARKAKYGDRPVTSYAAQGYDAGL